jgi:hypothetical protein
MIRDQVGDPVDAIPCSTSVSSLNCEGLHRLSLTANASLCSFRKALSIESRIKGNGLLLSLLRFFENRHYLIPWSFQSPKTACFFFELVFLESRRIDRVR